MNILEKTLEDIVFETDNVTLQSKGLWIEGKKKRQVRIGNYGIADIVAVHREYYGPRQCALVIHIIELKKEKIGIASFLQAIRYAKGIQRYLTNERDFKFHYKFRISLIGTDIDLQNPAFVYISELMDNWNILESGVGLLYYVMKLDMNGIHFEEQGQYSLTNEGF